MDQETERQIVEANAAFYKALEAGSLDRMDEVWAHEAWVRCVHPGWEVIAGWQQVRDSWARIFEGGQRLRVSPADVYVRAEAGFAWVTCTENLTVFDEDSFDSAQTVATNLFILREGRWLMVHHHASPIPSILPEMASDFIQ